MSSNSTVSSNNRLATRLAYVITLAWAVSFLVDIFVISYEPPASVHPLMMLVAGAVFGEGLIKARNGKPPPKENKDE